MAAKAKASFRTKKDRFFRERKMEIESKYKEISRKMAKKDKAAGKIAKKAKKLLNEFEGFWLWQWCCPPHYTGHRRVTKVELDYRLKVVYVWFEGGQPYRVYPESGTIWPVKSDLNTLEVEYNEKGNLLPQVHDKGSGHIRQGTTPARRAH